MVSFNSSSKVVPFGKSGVILPQSSSVLNQSQIDAKIIKTEKQLQHLSQQQSHRKTHGGDRFRARKISLQNQIDSSAQRLNMLIAAKKLMGTVNLQTIRYAEGDINKMRVLLEGNQDLCLQLFRKALEKKDAVLQIQLTHVYFGMKWGKDNEKDFSSLALEDLEKFSYYPRQFALFSIAYEQATGQKSNREIEEATFRLAASRGYPPAVLELTHVKWMFHEESYGFAAELRPYVGKGDHQIDYYFGKALKNGCNRGSMPYYEGLYWMCKSGGMSVKCPKKSQEFTDFVDYYLAVEDRSIGFYDYDGFWYIGTSVVLAESQQTWEKFVKEKLETVEIAPKTSYLFHRDLNHIKSLVDQHKISFNAKSSLVDSCSEGQKIKDWVGKTRQGFTLETVEIFQNNQSIGCISVRGDTFKIHITFKNADIQPVIDFIENVMSRSGSADSIYEWFNQMCFPCSSG